MRKIDIDIHEINIDWGRPQYVVDNDGDMIIITTGNHIGGQFEGMVLPCDEYPDGQFDNTWSKSCFKPLNTPVTVILSND